MNDPIILIDSFPFFLTVPEDDYSANVIIIQEGQWMGPETPEVKAARIQGLKDSWTEERRQQASELMAAQHPMPRAPTLSQEHKENIGKGMKGNQNKTGKRGGNQYTKLYK